MDLIVQAILILQLEVSYGLINMSSNESFSLLIQALYFFNLESWRIANVISSLATMSGISRRLHRKMKKLQNMAHFELQRHCEDWRKLKSDLCKALTILSFCLWSWWRRFDSNSTLKFCSPVLNIWAHR